MGNQGKSDFESALDQSLELIRTGRATVEQCLAQHAEHAAELRPLLDLAWDIRRSPLPAPSSQAYAAGRFRMLQAVTEQTRTRAAAESRRGWRPVWRHVWPTRAPSFVFAAVAMLLIVGVSLSWMTWRAGVVSRTATLTKAAGNVQLLPGGAGEWRSATAGAVIAAGDRLRTGEASAAALRFADGSDASLSAGTELALVTLQSRRDGRGRVVALYQWSGETHHRVTPSSGSGSVYQVETTAALTRVRGTEFTVRVEERDVTRVNVMAGIVAVTAGEVTRQVSAGEATVVEPEGAPVPASPPQRPSETPQPSHTPLRPSDTPQPSHTPLRPSDTPEPNQTARPSDTPGPNQTAQHTQTPSRPAGTSQGPNQTPKP